MSRYLEEMTRLAARRGIKAEEKEDCLHLEMDDSTSARSWRAAVYAIGGGTRSRMLHEIIGDAQTAREYVWAMEVTPFLKAAGLVEEKFKLLMDYGGYVLAGQDRGQYGFQFVTWEWDWNHAGVGTGNYWESNYQGAKEDFAVRAGLVRRNQLFNEEQSMVRHRLDEAIPDRWEKELLEESQRQLECSFPDLDGKYLVEQFASDPQTGYTLIEPHRRACHATDLYGEDFGSYLSKASAEEFPDAKPFESPYDGLAKLCRENETVNSHGITHWSWRSCWTRALR